MKSIKNNNKKGFSLVEVLVSVSIFLMVVVLVSGSFSSFLKNYQKNRDIQISLENAQQVMNDMAKTIRVSSIANSEESDKSYVKIFENSSLSGNHCIEYKIIDSKLKYASSSQSDLTACESFTFDNDEFKDLISSEISNGKFNVIETGSGKIGKVTISLEIKQKDGTKTPVQTTVSLRDY